MTELAESGSFLGYVLVFFIIAAYLPHVIFKFIAEQNVDLGWRRDNTRVEEFVSAAMPSVLLNLFAFLTYEFICAITPLESYDVDWAVIASLFAADKGALADFIYAGDLARSVGLYLVLLYMIAGINGRIYSNVIHSALLQGTFPPTIKELVNAPLRLHTIRDAIGSLWHIYYQDTLVPLFPWMVRETWVMVRTIDGRLYHGLFVRYEKTINGFETIQLEQVRRYCYNEIAQRYQRGQIAVSDFHGELLIKWSQVADINHVHPNKIFDIMYAQYLELKDFREAQGLPAPPIPEGLDLPSEAEDAQEESVSSPS